MDDKDPAYEAPRHRATVVRSSAEDDVINNNSPPDNMRPAATAARRQQQEEGLEHLYRYHGEEHPDKGIKFDILNEKTASNSNNIRSSSNNNNGSSSVSPDRESSPASSTAKSEAGGKSSNIVNDVSVLNQAHHLHRPHAPDSSVRFFSQILPQAGVTQHQTAGHHKFPFTPVTKYQPPESDRLQKMRKRKENKEKKKDKNATEIENGKEDKAWNIDSILANFGEGETKKDKKSNNKNKVKNNNKEANNSQIENAGAKVQPYSATANSNTSNNSQKISKNKDASVSVTITNGKSNNSQVNTDKKNNNRSASPDETTPLLKGQKSNNQLQQQNGYDSTKKTKSDNDNSNSTEVKKAKTKTTDSLIKGEEETSAVIKPEGSNANDKNTNKAKGSKDTTPQPQSSNKNQNVGSSKKSNKKSSDSKNSSENMNKKSSGGNNNNNIQTSASMSSVPQQLLQNSSKQLSNSSEGLNGFGLNEEFTEVVGKRNKRNKQRQQQQQQQDQPPQQKQRNNSQTFNGYSATPQQQPYVYQPQQEPLSSPIGSSVSGANNSSSFNDADYPSNASSRARSNQVSGDYQQPSITDPHSPLSLSNSTGSSVVQLEATDFPPLGGGGPQPQPANPITGSSLAWGAGRPNISYSSAAALKATTGDIITADSFPASNTEHDEAIKFQQQNKQTTAVINQQQSATCSSSSSHVEQNQVVYNESSSSNLDTSNSSRAFSDINSQTTTSPSSAQDGVKSDVVPDLISGEKGFGGAAMKETANSSGVGGNGKNNTEIINSITVVNSVNANSSAHHLRHHQQAVAANLPDVASQVPPFATGSSASSSSGASVAGDHTPPHPFPPRQPPQQQQQPTRPQQPQRSLPQSSQQQLQTIQFGFEINHDLLKEDPCIVSVNNQPIPGQQQTAQQQPQQKPTTAQCQGGSSSSTRSSTPINHHPSSADESFRPDPEMSEEESAKRLELVKSLAPKPSARDIQHFDLVSYLYKRWVSVQTQIRKRPGSVTVYNPSNDRPKEVVHNINSNKHHKSRV